MVLSADFISRDSDKHMRKEVPKEREAEAAFPRRVYPLYQLIAELYDTLKNAKLSQSDIDALQWRKAPEGMPHDYGFACYFLAKREGKNVNDVAKALAPNLNMLAQESGLIRSYEAIGPYVNFTINYETYGTLTVQTIKEMGSNFGAENIGQGDHVIIDSSSPNAAKEAHVGHLRSTLIGESLARTFRLLGFIVTKDNHLGDWGTGFGHLLNALGSLENLNKITNDQIQVLQRLYIEITEAGKTDPTVIDEGRKWFLQLEKGESQAREMWRLIREWSVASLEEIYEMLDVSFDTWMGESDYEDQLEDTLARIIDAGITEISDDCLIVDLQSEDNGVAILRTSDGRSQYITRDLATFIYHREKQQSKKVIYVVGGEQKPVFRQLFSILEKIGYPISEEDLAVHVDFGMMKLPNGEKMSTREGTAVPLKTIIEEALRVTAEIIKEKTRLPGAEELARVAQAVRDSNGAITWFDLVREKDEEIFVLVKQIAMGALKWNDLMQTPLYDVTFDMRRMLSLKGDSSLYVQYEHARCASIMEKARTLHTSHEVKPTHKLEVEVIKILNDFPDVIKKAAQEYNPSVITTITHRLAKAYNKMYMELHILDNEDETARSTRVNITEAVMITLRNGLYLLGIGAPARM